MVLLCSFFLHLKLSHHLFQLFGRLLRCFFSCKTPAVFCGLKDFTRLSISMRVTRWWLNFHFWVNYPFNKFAVNLRLLSVFLRYSVIKSCCQWKDQDRPSLAELSRKLLSGEKGASDRILKVSGTVNVEQYLQEAGYGETNSYTVFWSTVWSVPAK